MNRIEKRICASAFNQGADARLHGLDLSANPYYSAGGSANLWKSWNDGWRDVSRNWGKSRLRGYEPASLPEITLGGYATPEPMASI